MPWDLQLSQHSDLVFGANRDLAFVRGADLVSQRILIRLKLPIGSFMHNTQLGSNLRVLLSATNSAEWQARGAAMVTQALRPMPDLTLQSVTVTEDPENPRAVIVYIEAGIAPEGASTPIVNQFKDQFAIALAPGDLSEFSEG